MAGYKEDPLAGTLFLIQIHKAPKNIDFKIILSFVDDNNKENTFTTDLSNRRLVDKEDYYDGYDTYFYQEFFPNINCNKNAGKVRDTTIYLTLNPGGEYKKKSYSFPLNAVTYTNIGIIDDRNENQYEGQYCGCDHNFTINKWEVNDVNYLHMNGCVHYGNHLVRYGGIIS